MIVLAHRGIRSHGPENSLAGFQGVADAAARGVPIGIEFDARRTADDVLITVHDGDLWHTNGQFPDDQPSHFVYCDAWYESAKHFLGETCPPRLDEALAVVSRVPFIDIDIKERGYTGAVIDTCSQIDPERLAISSHIPEVIIEARQLAPEGMKVGMSVDEHWLRGESEIFSLLERVGADFLFLDHRLITPAFVEQMHNMGKSVGAYTVNEKERLLELIEMGVDYPCTDKPEMAVTELLIHPEVAEAQ